jgi:phosphatidylserine/phosphatidylglycerophosphate/cardiolipin synthase-like enzyme
LAQRRGVDVRVLLGGDETVASDLWIANQVALQLLQVLDISVRNYRSGFRTNSHSKVVLIDDDWLVLGSHNWSPRSFSVGLDDSIAICSAPMAAELRGRFLHTWRESLPASHRADAGRSDYSPGRVFRRNVLTGLNKHDRRAKSPTSRIAESMTGDLIEGRSYVECFADLAEQAQKSIKVVQFYFSYDGRPEPRLPPCSPRSKRHTAAECTLKCCWTKIAAETFTTRTKQTGGRTSA